MLRKTKEKRLANSPDGVVPAARAAASPVATDCLCRQVRSRSPKRVGARYYKYRETRQLPGAKYPHGGYPKDTQKDTRRISNRDKKFHQDCRGWNECLGVGS
jgi:hypothetical protein